MGLVNFLLLINLEGFSLKKSYLWICSLRHSRHTTCTVQ